MNVILGGAYQGKEEYARGHFRVTQVYECPLDVPELPEGKECLAHLERFALACVRAGAEPLDYVREHFTRLTGAVVLCEDIFCGVVPVEPEMRAWREATGRMMNWLCAQADSVTRMFCGIPQKLR